MTSLVIMILGKGSGLGRDGKGKEREKWDAKGEEIKRVGVKEIPKAEEGLRDRGKVGKNETEVIQERKGG